MSEQKTIGIIGNSKNRKLIGNLEQQGKKIVAFPELETKALKIGSEAIDKILDFDWLIFTDLYSVDYFLQSLEEKEINFFDLDALRICALGEAVADRLRFRQIHSDVIPLKMRLPNIVAALDDYIFSRDFSGLKFLIVKETGTNFELAELLSKKNAATFEIPVYTDNFTSLPGMPKLKALVRGGGIDEFVFTSPEDVFYVSRLFDYESLEQIFAGIKITPIDEVTRRTFEEHF